MGRGRRPNLALEPTRALQTQRAFRQRKAEHLAQLEESVRLLGEENAKLRRMLHLDPNPPTTNTKASSPPAAAASASASPSTSTSHSGSAAIAPRPRAKDVDTPGSSGDPAVGCEHCAPIAETNRQLAIAAAQVEAQMRALQQSVKALRSVLVHHGIPIPSPLASTPSSDLVGSEEPRQNKRLRMTAEAQLLPPLIGEAEPPSGIHMTSHYYSHNNSSSSAISSAPSPSTLEMQYRRPPHPSTSSAGIGAWHTPSPSNILSAPTPPSATFSPRHSYSASGNYAHASSASTSTNIAGGNEEGGYRKFPTRQNSGSSSRAPPQLPIPNSPARQSNHLPPWSTTSSSNAAVHSPTTHTSRPHAYHPGTDARDAAHSGTYARSSPYNTSGYQGGVGGEHRYSQPPSHDYPHRSYFAAASAASPSYAASPLMMMTDHHSSVGATAGPLHSPRTRTGQSPRDLDIEAYPARPVASSYAPHHRTRTTSISASGGTREVENMERSKCGPTADSDGGSGSGSGGCGQGKKDSSTQAAGCCPPSETKLNNCGNDEVSKCSRDAAKHEEKWDGPATLGVSFDMRTTGKSNSTQVAKEDQDPEECCLGLVNCDFEGRIII
ncbi:uncharacterized protein UTRI_00553_B [Ustilago trichophora]|uniref:BZIP domain-containing protein n=1 Tax=Ustilago trichophora TaxID=86804 RepID=A0A5C3DRU8_9BASI|nr:uncharacterized protein UTRI_00553_B [Ustilago trichophora]